MVLMAVMLQTTGTIKDNNKTISFINTYGNEIYHDGYSLIYCIYEIGSKKQYLRLKIEE
jgi:hypothetical protein